ncbi:MAG TPA: hypothetical protein VJN95_14645 [Gemmatimonadales bacterium]|nr:hypothetical protein [Gemmatimonadales bacterium]
MRFKHLSSLVIIGLLAAVPLRAQAPGAADEANMQILRDKVKADKKLVVASNMTLTDAEAKAFWPIYDEYQKDLAGINQRTVKVIADYAKALQAGPVADSTAKRLLDESLAIEQAEVALRQSYVPKLGKALPAAKVARYLQIESKIRAVIKYDLASHIPLVE